MTIEPLRPEASDEAPHAPETTPLWNESWYFDFADPGQGVGGWIRLGLMPNEGVAWINALLCGPQMPTIALLDFEAALPTEGLRLRSETFDLTLEAIEPLREYRVVMRGDGQAYDDPGAILRGEAGRSVDMALDLTWNTAGTPYQYRMTPRYEIPCTVSGAVTHAHSEIHLDAVPGQRDHSWGAARDWWGLEWMWSALHLGDGCHLHAVDARIPGLPAMGVGYIQQPGERLAELEAVSAHEVFADSGLPVSAVLSLEPGAVVAELDVCGHAPVRLISPSGQVAHFPRAWATVALADGRTGVGWIEWNKVVSH